METILAAKPEILEEIPTDASSVVEASAGTGKTYTLEHLIVELVVEEDISISNILVVTFTERATAELVERVRRILQRLLEQTQSDATHDEPHWEIDEQKRRRLRKALFSFDRAPIHTIHGFCHRILVEHAFANRRPFDQELADFDRLFDEAFHESLREDFADGTARRLLLETYAQANSVDDLQGKLKAAVGTTDQIEPLGDFEAFAAETGAVERHISSLGSVLAEMRRVFDEVDAQGKMNGRKRNKAYRQLEGLRKAVDAHADEGLAGFWATVMAECDAENPLDYLAEPSMFNESHRNRFRDTWVDQLERMADHYFDPLPLVLDAFVPLVEKRLERIKSDNGAFTYNDMLRYVRDALEDNPELIRTLRDEYAFALVDEFQDTDPVQWKILQHLFVDSNGRNPCVLIGDPKQAIYGFRGADVRTYSKAVARLTGSTGGRPDEPARLPKNYRSTPALIDAYNLILDPGDSSSFFRSENGYGRAVGAGLPSKRMLDEKGRPVEPVVVTRVDASADGDVSSDGFQGAVFSAWADEIRRLVDEQTPEETLRLREEEGDEVEETAVGPGDIFVLTRTKSQGDEFAEYLRAAGVPYAFYKREGLFRTPEARDWYAALRAADGPGDRSRRLKAWSTPFFGLGLDRAAEAAEVVDEGHALVDRLDTWHRHGRSGRIGQLVHQILDGSGLLRRQVFEKHGQRELTNYEHLAETFVDWAQSDDLSLGEIVARLGRYIDGEAEPEGKEGDLQRLETDEQAVQIMTMHKAKGLSAPVVFVYGGYGRAPRDTYRYYDEQEEPVRYFGGKSDSGDRKSRIQAYQEEEDERLLYVAMTRPKGRLYLPYAAPEERGGNLERSNSPAGPLVERLDELLAEGAPEGFRVDARTVDPSPPRTAAEPEIEDSPVEVDLEEVAAAVEEAEADLPVDRKTFGQLRADRRLYVESYKSVDSWLGPDEDETRTNEALALDERAEPDGGEPEADRDSDGPPPGQTTGLCVHEMFEDLDYETARRAGDLDEWRRRDEVATVVDSIATRYGLADYEDELAALVWRGLTSPVRAGDLDLPSISATDRQSMELEFWYPIPGETGARLPDLVDGNRPDSPRSRDGYLRGFIDLVFEWNGRLYIADWKTDTRDGEEAYSPDDVTAVVEERYGIQSTFYATAAARLVARAVEDREQFEERFGGFMYLFVRGMGPERGDRSPGVVFERPSFQELLDLEQRTGDLVERKLRGHRERIAAGPYDRWRA